MRMRFVTALGLVLAGLAGAPAVTAQNLEMATPPPAATASESNPARGLSMSQVEQRFGAPAERYAAVGSPPITRWVYPTFVVYFEHEYVIHTVAVRQ